MIAANKTIKDINVMLRWILQAIKNPIWVMQSASWNRNYVRALTDTNSALRVYGYLPSTYQAVEHYVSFCWDLERGLYGNSVRERITDV